MIKIIKFIFATIVFMTAVTLGLIVWLLTFNFKQWEELLSGILDNLDTWVSE